MWYSVICSFLLQSGAHFIVGCLGWCGTLPTFMTSVAKVDPRNVYGINVGRFMSEEINNWVQIVNSKTGRTPRFNELCLKLPDFQ